MNHRGPATLKCFETTSRHPRFQECLSELVHFFRFPGDKRLCIVVGVAGSGKSKLKDELIKHIVAESQGEMASDPEHIPYASIKIKAPGPTAFSWKDPYNLLLGELRHPFAGKSPDPRLNEISTGGNQSRERSISQRSNDYLFRVLQTTIEHRKPKALIFDEGQHVLRLTTAQSVRNQLDHLKFFADEMDTPIYIFGQYELMVLANLSAQVVRRREVTHLGRYIFDVRNPESSLRGFASAVAHFNKDLREFCAFELLKEVPYLYEGSVGCVGILHDWLLKTYNRRTALGTRSITKALLEETIMSVSDRKQILSEALEGESRLTEGQNDEREYLRDLGFVAAEDESIQPKVGRKRRLPGRRNPHNDPVGTHNLRAGAEHVAA